MKSKAAVLETPTDSENFAEHQPITVEEIDVPSPVGDEVRVKVGAASLCHTDVKMITGQIPEQFPLVLGHEGAGIVHDVGEDVTSVEAGDHVVLGRVACGRCGLCRRDYGNLCELRGLSQKKGSLKDGSIRFSQNGDTLHHCHGVSSLSEYTIVDEEVAIKVSDGIPMNQATLLGCAIFTGFGAVTNTVEVEPGSSVAIFGGGGVGLSALQAAHLSGATEVILVDLIPEKLDLAYELGATHTVDARNDDALDEVRAIGGNGVDYAFDTVGSIQTVENIVEVLAPTGTAVVVGGPPSGKQAYDLNIANMVYTEQTLLGSFNGSYDLPVAIPKIAKLAEQGKINLEKLVSNTMELDEINTGMHNLVHSPSIREVISF